MAVRIAGGEARGRQLAVPRGAGVRPATARLRASLFDMLRAQVVQARVLDLFAGAGLFGLEAVSRGAQRATFVERDPRCLRALCENLRRLGWEDRAVVIRGDALVYPGGLDAAGGYGIAFADPPYSAYARRAWREAWVRLVHRLLEGDTLAPGGTLVLKHPARLDLSPLPRPFLSRTYGDTRLSLYKAARA